MTESAIRKVFLETQVLHQHVKEPLPTEDEKRDTYLAEIDSYLSLRQESMQNLNPPKGQEENSMASLIIKMNKEINDRLEEIQLEIKHDINQLKQRKATSKKYDNPYEGQSTDGIFIDSKN